MKKSLLSLIALVAGGAALAGCANAPVQEPELQVTDVAYDSFLEELVSGGGPVAEDKRPEDKIKEARLDKAEQILGAVFDRAD